MYNLTVTMTIDGNPNFLYYSPETRNKDIFNDYVKFWDELEIPSEYKHELKIVRNALWGSFGTKNYVHNKMDDENFTFEASMSVIDALDNDTNHVMTIDKSNYYLYDTARMMSFITSIGQLITMTQLQNHMDKIIYINCDGFYSTEIIESIPVSNKRGDFKYKFCDKIELKNKNSCKEI
jgi:hypothetical protein